MDHRRGPVCDPREPRFYNRLAARYEHPITKYCTILGTSVAGVVAYTVNACDPSGDLSAPSDPVTPPSPELHRCQSSTSSA